MYEFLCFYQLKLELHWSSETITEPPALDNTDALKWS